MANNTVDEQKEASGNWYLAKEPFVDEHIIEQDTTNFVKKVNHRDRVNDSTAMVSRPKPTNKDEDS